MYAEDPAFVAAEDFGKACRSLAERSQDVELVDMRLEMRGEQDLSYLVISRALPIPSFPPGIYSRAKTIVVSEEDLSLSDGEEELQNQQALEEDDHAAVHHHKPATPTIEYNILFSQTYRVPVLYFFLHDLPFERRSSIDTVHELLVPPHIRSSLQNIGVMGGISMTNHPITDVPAYFIHPCNTAEAMREITRAKILSPLEYLQVWIGLIGSCVGLYLPSQLI